jgi:hypothetical protein
VGGPLARWFAGVALAVVVAVLSLTVWQEALGGRVAAGARSGLASLPAAARGPVSAALGRDDPSYRVAGLRALSPAQGLRTAFSGDGVTVISGRGRVRLTLAGFGLASALRPIASSLPVAVANRVNYLHPGVREWYVNGPLGLEQGFDVLARPAAGSGPLTLEVALSGDLRARLDHGSVLLIGGGVGLRYTGLRVADARGRTLRSWLQLARGRILIRVSDRDAVYPLRVDPLVQRGSKLVGTGASGAAAQGYSVALSRDGNTALIGGAGDNGNAGAAWVFSRSASGVWSQQGSRLSASDETGAAKFGSSVVLSSDGDTALIGGPDDSGVGAAWVFTRSASGVWSQQGAKLVGTDANGTVEQEGWSVALSGDGNTAVIGGAEDDYHGGAGDAWAFTRSAGGAWSQQGSRPIVSIVSNFAHQGLSVALSSDGNTALIGVPFANRAWVLTQSGGVWSLASILVGTGTAGTSAQQGWSVALSADGNTALIGGPRDNSLAGAAWVFTRSASGVWGQQGAKLVGTGASGGGSQQGNSVALSSDGNTALVGGPGDVFDPVTGNGTGAAWVFTRSASRAWSQQGSKLVGTGISGLADEGSGVALSDDGSTALVGGPGDSGGTGAAWVFVNEYTLAVAKAGSGSGLVSSSPAGIDCGSSCQTSFPSGAQVTLTALPAAGSVFAGWSGGGCSGTRTCQVTINSDATVTATFTHTAPPSLSGLKLSPSKFVLAGRLVGGRCVAQTRANDKRRHCTRPVKLQVSYRLNVAATVTITIKRALAGRLVAGRCVAQTTANRHHRSCTRQVAVHGTLTRAGVAGLNSFTFDGRIGGRRLGAGSYRLTATPSLSGKASTPRTVAFTITS